MRDMSMLHALFGGRPFQLPILDAVSRISAPESYPNGPGWTCAHVKRMAAKKRNRARHKAAVRRASR